MAPPNRDAEYLNLLRDYYAKYRTWPSYARMGDVVGLKAKSAVFRLLHRLESAGHLQRTPDGEWAPTDQFFERPLVDATVRAGLPEMVMEASENPVLIDTLLVRSPSRTVLLPVKGDSMQDAGIFEGDFVIVERCSTANSGALVVAEVDGEFTLKTLVREAGEWTLHPANENYPVIRPKGSLSLFGVVTGLIRRYGKR
ncbi:MAG: LexA family transcriptional regulator [Magnetococcales bacterium]|nr:LexA family transcriptional regulator [Magnetococcales bacterium]MBF0583614.1 LexA family transcriptional regulator [Magnetococcales bacterium]